VSTIVLDDFGPLSPELVLVAPPDVAERARSLLTPYERPAAAPAVSPSPSVLGVAAFYAGCAATTIGPLTLLLFAAR
jgi:hypothetical protein